MSLFLGRIHYWLYNKILWFEGIEERIVQAMKGKFSATDTLVRYAADNFGEPTGGKPLETIIDTSNIHGWLQDKIKNAELRQAVMITGFLKWDPGVKAELIGIYSKQGEEAAREIGDQAGTPEDIYNAMNDFILEGMPCDRVNEIVDSTNDEFTWETTACLHKEYWERVGGDVRNFYHLREAWMKAFVETANPGFTYMKTGDGLNRITRKQ